MSATIPVPIWVIVLFAVLGIVWQWAMAVQTKAMRDLYDIYLRERDEIPAPDPERLTP
jgi:hypothetical protein